MSVVGIVANNLRVKSLHKQSIEVLIADNTDKGDNMIGFDVKMVFIMSAWVA